MYIQLLIETNHVAGEVLKSIALLIEREFWPDSVLRAPKFLDVPHCVVDTTKLMFNLAE